MSPHAIHHDSLDKIFFAQKVVKSLNINSYRLRFIRNYDFLERFIRNSIQANQNFPIATLQCRCRKHRSSQSNLDFTALQITGICHIELRYLFCFTLNFLSFRFTFSNFNHRVINNISTIFLGCNKYSRSLRSIENRIGFVYGLSLCRSLGIKVILSFTFQFITSQQFKRKGILLSISIGTAKRSFFVKATANRHGIVTMATFNDGLFTLVIADNIEYVVATSSTERRFFNTNSLNADRVAKCSFLRNDSSIIAIRARNVQTIESTATIDRERTTGNRRSLNCCFNFCFASCFILRFCFYFFSCFKVMDSKRIVTKTARHIQLTLVVEGDDGIHTNTTFNIQGRIFGNAVAEIFFISSLDRFKAIIRSNALRFGLAFRIIELADLDLIVTGTAIDVRHLGRTIDVNLIVTTIGVNIHDIDTLREVDAFDIRVGKCFRCLWVLRCQSNKAKCMFNFFISTNSLFLGIHTHQHCIVVFSTFDGKHVLFCILTRIRNVGIAGIATAHKRDRDLIVTTLTVDKVHARARNNLIVTILNTINFYTYGIFIESP